MPIRPAEIADTDTLAMLIRESNQDVAIMFGLNAENCAKHPSFCTGAWIDADFQRGERYFIFHAGPAPVACVAYETPRPGLAYLNRLSVLPAHRRQGIGEHLVRFIIDKARSEAVSTLSIGVIGEHLALQEWYAKLGFAHGETKRFAHLPFSVKYMAYGVARG
ncbi:MAG: GNAT family N-acetyltransferase [Pseudomonas sp.]|uniref:GNAT family N-acetyltransferase n=1 Tax=Pseudomonas sp. TaxID=306 RepID=UPI00299D33E6|nr:GNAT family N-acetyltransferase [Pseudomonas sp.]MDX1721620.1 GNAT family N-acetyltransferase [Pseudomonas sp.]